MVAIQQFPATLRSKSDILGPKPYRIAQEGDVAWMADLGRRRYPGNYDIEAAEMWMRNIVLRQPMMFYPTRTDNAFMVTLIALLPWLPGEPEASVVMLCAEDGHIWDSVKLARASLDWAIRRNCFKWGFNSDTAFDIGPIAQRMGLVNRCPRYVVNLR
jgi:hypothetical protein